MFCLGVFKFVGCCLSWFVGLVVGGLMVSVFGCMLFGGGLVLCFGV